MHIHQSMSRGSMHAARQFRPSQQGFTLVELLVSMAIGLIVSLAVMMGYLGASQAQRGQTDLSRMQETARFGFDLFGRETRHAGFANNTSANNASFLAFQTTNASNTMITGSNDATTITPVGGSATTVINKGDIVTFRYYGVDKLDNSGADGTILNCTGTAIRAMEMNEDTLYIARDTSNTTNDSAGEPTLFCASRVYSVSAGTWATGTGSPVALIPGVESMQIIYGEDTDGDGVINRYVPPAGLAKSDFTQVNSMIVSFVVRSPGASGFTAAQTLNHFGTDYAPGGVAPSTDTGSVFTSPSDGRLRRVYNTVFSFRNKSILS